ncbi:uncharacterized protein [Triticum aestivum]|uniref:uncharacterized protein isoform X1 n=1 Tax=Triticum aestivum TaxID=4565 RepID=UPI001D019C70|nr:uncharacterized protein LOC123049371 isoform X1 [Triticum aestivum]
MSPLHPPHLHFRKLKKRARAAIGSGSGSGSHHPAAKARKGLAAILYKLRDVHRPPSSPPSPSPSPSTPHHRQLCYPPAPSTWPWPSCRHPRTSSFRARPGDAAAVVYRTANTVYDTPSEHFMRRPSVDEASCSGRNSFAVSGQAAVDREPEAEERKELRLRETAVVCGVRSERLFFEPAGAGFFSPTQVMHSGDAWQDRRHHHGRGRRGRRSDHRAGRQDRAEAGRLLRAEGWRGGGINGVGGPVRRLPSVHGGDGGGARSAGLGGPGGAPGVVPQAQRQGRPRRHRGRLRGPAREPGDPAESVPAVAVAVVVVHNFRGLLVGHLRRRREVLIRNSF